MRRLAQPDLSDLGYVKPYALRHSFASVLLAEGRSVHYVARQLGHAPSMTLDVYGHVVDELEDGGQIARKRRSARHPPRITTFCHGTSTR